MPLTTAKPSNHPNDNGLNYCEPSKPLNIVNEQKNIHGQLAASRLSAEDQVPVQMNSSPQTSSLIPLQLEKGKARVGNEARLVRAVKREEEYLPLMYVDSEIDRIASLIGLVMIGVMTKGTKMTKGAHCYAPKSPAMSANKWIPQSINSAYLPEALTKGIYKVERSFSQDSKDDLGFFGHCITYVHKLYPESSDPQMTLIWTHVRDGIITLKRQYTTEPPTMLSKEMVARWGSEGLKEGMSFNEMFDHWIAQVESYYEERKEVVPQGTIKGEFLPAPISSSLLALLDCANNAKVETPLAASAIDDLKTILESLVNTGKIPRKLHSLSVKIKELWSKENIYNKVVEIQKLGKEKDLTVKNVKLAEMIEELEMIAIKYAEIVKMEMIEVMSL